MYALVRLLLLIAALAVCVFLIAAHGVRGIAILILVALVATLPGTRVWKAVERRLVRITGSRQRAAAVVMFVVIGGVAAVDLYNLVR